MKKKTLIGLDGNAFFVMGVVLGWMKDAFEDAKKPDLEGMQDSEAMTLFGPAARDAYTKDATSSDYNHLLTVSAGMAEKINEYWERSPSFNGWDDED